MKKIIKTAHGKIILRPFEEKDIEPQMIYFYESPKDFLLSIGFDTSKFLGREKHAERLKESLKIPPKIFLNIIAELEGKTIGQVSLFKNNKDADLPNAHFHIWDENFRGKGLGKIIFLNGVEFLMENQSVDSALIEPHKENIPMNALMKSCGFEFLKETTYSGHITTTFPANQYLIKRNQI